MAGLVCRVGGQLGGRQGEDQPPVPGINRREPEHVSEESANPVGVLGEDHRVGPGNHEYGSLVMGCSADALVHDSASD